MRIVIIGTGNTATVLGKLFLRQGHTIVQVFGRNVAHSELLANTLSVPFTTNSKQLEQSADIYLLAVSDNAIESVASWLRVDKKLVLHSAASVKMDVLSACSKNYGVLYPLQSLRKEIKELPVIPFIVNGNTGDNCTLISDFAKTISNIVMVANDHQRIMTHVAAVFVSNFTNHLYSLAEDFCKKEKLDFTILHPLIAEVAARVEAFSPAQVQTGPAARNDQATIQKHLQLLAGFPDQQEIYRILTQSISRNAGGFAADFTD